jgi:type IV pilus assembly protein PilN
MRFNINLASQPYEAARQFRQRMGALMAALGLIGILLVSYIVYQRIQSRGINRQLSEVRQEIDGLNREEAQARAILNKPQNREVADQSEFLNQLFVRKALSWTRVFGELERIMPYDLHVVSMKPEYTKTNDLMVRIMVATGARPRAVELVRRMEKSSHFRQAEIVGEAVTANVGDQSAGPGNIQFDIAALYVPGAQDEDAAADDDKKKSGDQPAKATASAAKSPTGPATPVSDAARAEAKSQPRSGPGRQH